jgi:hypothetical protein
MDWIKRNLYFLIGSLVALALMGLTSYYLYSKWQLNNKILGELEAQYAELGRLHEQKPHPGSGKVDNIKAAKDQQQELRDYIRKTRQYFQPCPPIPQPESGKLTSQDFSSALSRTVDQMQRDAAKVSVALPPKDSKGSSYSFSFAAQKESLAYATGSLEPLSVQLGEVKAICAVLLAAKINSLDNLRRERVSEDDSKGPQTDYLSEKSVTNELAVLTPYEVSFRCFSSELAAVLAGFANSPCGMMVIKTINVESAPAEPVSEQLAPPVVSTAPVYNAPPPPRPRAEAPGGAEAAFARRYGLGGGRMGPRPAAPQPAPVYAQPAPLAAPSANKGGLPLVLDEKQLKVTLMLNVVKLVPSK